MSRRRCRAMVPDRHYSRGGQCEKRVNVQVVEIKEGGDRLRVALCKPHRKIADDHRPLEFAP